MKKCKTCTFKKCDKWESCMGMNIEPELFTEELSNKLISIYNEESDKGTWDADVYCYAFEDLEYTYKEFYEKQRMKICIDLNWKKYHKYEHLEDTFWKKTDRRGEITYAHVLEIEVVENHCEFNSIVINDDGASQCNFDLSCTTLGENIPITREEFKTAVKEYYKNINFLEEYIK